MMENNKNNAIQPIGSYLARNPGGKVMSIDQALDIQAELEKLGIYKPLGRIIV
jgi:hypothetical protein